MSRYDVPTFIKWVGGKSSLLAQYDSLGLFPQKVDRYIEPFIGGGSVFFFIKRSYNPKEIYLSDRNRELVICYEVIQKDPKSLIEQLKVHKANSSEDYYYRVRDIDINFTLMSKVEIAARFIYLNKTCFNGLYRVNSKGRNNSPFGNYKNPSIYDENVIKDASALLYGANLSIASYEAVRDVAESGDFIYFDPPYYKISSTSSFTDYTDVGFTADDQLRLSMLFKELNKRGCLCMLSNSYCDFILDLYGDFNVNIISVRRMINSDGKGRNEIREVAITNYERTCHQASLFEF
ncbi:MAG: Dam family site-specific DNA-(adenine-N6)-methyltransferase [Sideroxydans sp.]|nr:Dam family site-specific DNA-(adenine-N6)-methyltransferase [Sideroxydans sp.]